MEWDLEKLYQFFSELWWKRYFDRLEGVGKSEVKSKMGFQNKSQESTLGRRVFYYGGSTGVSFIDARKSKV